MNTYEPEFCARCLQLDEVCKCYAPTDDTHTEPCEACRMIREDDSDMTEEQARTAYLEGVELCGDCQAYFGLGEWVDSLKGGN